MEDANDNLVYIHIKAGKQGVSQISLQTDTKPLQELGNPDDVSYRYAH